MTQGGAKRYIWYWLLITVLLAGIPLLGLFMPNRAADHPVLAQLRAQFLPGRTSVGHYQIELACEACHTTSFSNKQSIQEACVGCHGAELKQSDDKHPLAKFTDPRNAALLDKIDARLCVTCHSEHRPEITHAMGVTQPDDFCAHCHQDIAEERPSHENMAFDTCTNAGCHNFHDNRALYEDFLLRHAAEPAITGITSLTATNLREVAAILSTYPSDRYPLQSLSLAGADSPTAVNADRQVMNDWLASAHADAGVNCSACHGGAQDTGTPWVNQPTMDVCGQCHQAEQDSFKTGKHGMRLQQGLAPMTPAMARLPMRDDAGHRSLTCTSCHGAHRFDTRQASVQACLGCHSDEHSLAYNQSRHAELWQRELAGDSAPGSGVTCATCHMPRSERRHEEYDIRQIFVQHNQNDTLRPNEKMIRPVCMQCHGYGFSVDALADRSLIRGNFSSLPAHSVPGIDMAVARDRAIAEQRRSQETPP